MDTVFFGCELWIPEALVLPPTYSLNESKTDSALQAKLALLPTNKGLVAQGTLIIAQGSTINEQKYETLKALERSYDRTQSDSSIYSKLGLVAAPAPWGWSPA